MMPDFKCTCPIGRGLLHLTYDKVEFTVKVDGGEGYVKIPDDFALNGTDAFGGEYYVKDGESLVFTRRK